MSASLSVAQIVPCTEAEGPGRRFALWFQGCPLRCPGCCNPEMLSFEGGQKRSVEGVAAEIQSTQRSHGITGLTLLGGEPLAHAAGAAELSRAARNSGLSVMVFTGYTLEEARSLADPAVARLLELTDILVDGPFIRERPERRRRWIGSENQRIHFLTDRHNSDDSEWLQRNTVELRWDGAQLTVNGFPIRSEAMTGRWTRRRMPLKVTG